MEETGRNFGNFKAQSDLDNLKTFLDTEIGTKKMAVSQSYRKVIKIVKAVLENPRVLLIDQKALEFKTIKFAKTFRTIEELLPKTTFIVNMSTFDDLLELNNIIYMKEGMIIESGSIKELLLNSDSLLNTLTKYVDFRVFNNLYEKAGGKKRDDEIRNEIQEKRLNEKKKLEEERKKTMFGNSKTDLKSQIAFEYSDHTLKSKLDFQRNQEKIAKKLCIISEKCSAKQSKRQNTLGNVSKDEKENI